MTVLRRGTSWIEVATGSDFPLDNLPYGVFSSRVGVAIGEKILDLHALAGAGLLDGVIPREIAQAENLNPLLAAGRASWSALRERLTALLSDDADFGRVNRDALLVAQNAVEMQLPFESGDYVDFYSSLEHATNLGKIMRPDGDPLFPNWRWLPVGYHGRSSTIVVDGTPVTRPSGQIKPQDAAVPEYAATQMLDIELEMGFVTGAGKPIGSRIAIEEARDYIFGLVLVNDWSARDIQAWEYQPLGPFLGKSFATSISPWVVTLDALEPYRVAGPRQDPRPLPYLRTSEAWNYDVALSIELQTKQMRDAGQSGDAIARTNFKHMYWNMAQQLAHVTSNGTAIRAGDLYASGTISGAERNTCGSLIELTWRGSEPLALSSGERRSFLEDGDTVTLRGAAERDGLPRIGFGSVRGTILPPLGL